MYPRHNRNKLVVDYDQSFVVSIHKWLQGETASVSPCVVVELKSIHMYFI